ncbi:AfsR/SARP family transcriptional regulator [Sphaerisporangium perillae]|uniref:AfsR/SARP family transcriptional regulator n=1 Tax=Sphaerisporangium perillae TaxID=2935860 RepID=UPI00200C97FA|nr:BTAD domain-containing putative transcriptional regulator [Sphaerisporangium perillae]
MELRLLGPVEAWHHDQRLSLGGPKPRALLAALLLNAGRVVSTERLVESLWGDSPPNSAHALVQTYVHGLRRGLPLDGHDDLLQTRPPGYLIRPVPGQLDLQTFERKVAQGRDHATYHRHDLAAAELRAALAIWRGAALGGIGDALRGEAERLEQTRLTVLEERINAELAIGMESELIGELTELVWAYPTRERLRGQLMAALYRMGRQADALSVYHEGRRTLADELGVDPGTELRRLFEAILRGDASLTRVESSLATLRLPGAVEPPGSPPPSMAPPSMAGPPVSRSSPVPAPVEAARTGPAPSGEPVEAAVAHADPGHPGQARRDVVPGNLPRGLADFTGRDREVGELVTCLGTPSDAVTVCVISGKGGVGKSALAVKVAHQVIEAYPDGQLYADLRGGSGSPVPPADVLGRFLRALGVPPTAVPDTPDEIVDAYRSILTGRRVLILLDDAGSEQQVRPLVPGSPTCAVVITTRRRLAGLAGANHTNLDVLEPDTALELLARVVGGERVDAQRDAAQRIALLCGNLPLALRTAGARLVARPHWSLHTLATRLDDERRRLDELTAGDVEVRASVALSYEGLDEQAKKAFRALGLLGVPDFASWVVAALLGVSEPVGEEVLERLIDAQLVDFASVDAAQQERYRVHDLLRVYGAERAESEDTEEERAAAMSRALGGWLWLITHTASRSPSGALTLRKQYTKAFQLGEDVAERVATGMTAWFNTEAPALVTAVERAAAMDLHDVVCEVAAALCSSSFSVDSRFEEWWRTHDAALIAARRAGDLLGEGTLLVGLGQLRYRQDRYAEAKAFFHDALPLFRSAGDARGEAVTLAEIGTAYREEANFPQASLYLDLAIAAFRELGDDTGIGYVSRLAGSVCLERGEDKAALCLFDEALAAFRRLGSKRGEALTLRSISLVYRASGDLHQAEDMCARAVDLLRESGDTLMEAYAVQALAKTRIRLGKGASVLPDLVRAQGVCIEQADRFGEALILRTMGELHLAQGRYSEAEAHLIRSVGLWDDLSLPLFRARCLRDLARVNEANGKEHEAERLRSTALEIFSRFGTREYEELLA